MAHQVSRETQHERAGKRKPRQLNVKALPAQAGFGSLAVSESAAKLALQVEEDIIAASQMADIETFCDVVSVILERLLQENSTAKNGRPPKPDES